MNQQRASLFLRQERFSTSLNPFTTNHAQARAAPPGSATSRREETEILTFSIDFVPCRLARKM